LLFFKKNIKNFLSKSKYKFKYKFKLKKKITKKEIYNLKKKFSKKKNFRKKKFKIFKKPKLPVIVKPKVKINLFKKRMNKFFRKNRDLKNKKKLILQRISLRKLKFLKYFFKKKYFSACKKSAISMLYFYKFFKKKISFLKKSNFLENLLYCGDLPNILSIGFLPNFLCIKSFLKKKHKNIKKNFSKFKFRKNKKIQFFKIESVYFYKTF
jgi:hypothetical protein